MQLKQTFTFGDFSQRKIVRTITFSSGFLLTKTKDYRILIGCNRHLLLIKIYAGISNIFNKVDDLLKLQESNKGIKHVIPFIFKLPYLNRTNKFHEKDPRLFFKVLLSLVNQFPHQQHQDGLWKDLIYQVST